LSIDLAKFAAKCYQLYLKEEEEEKNKRIRHLEDIVQYVITLILWLIKLITYRLEKVNIKRKPVIEIIPVE
jgi:hypothetical protein